MGGKQRAEGTSTYCSSALHAASVVKLGRGVEAAVEEKVGRLVKLGPVREAIMVPWRLDGAGRPPNVEVMAEVEAALGTVLGAATPAYTSGGAQGAGDEAGYRRGDSWRQLGWCRCGAAPSAGCGGSCSRGRGGEAAAAGASMGEGGEWVQQAGWGGAARGRRQRLEGGQEGVTEGARP